MDLDENCNIDDISIGIATESNTAQLTDTSSPQYLKLCLARKIYKEKMQTKLTTKGITWNQWWRNSYGEEFNDYVNSKIKAKSE